MRKNDLKNNKSSLKKNFFWQLCIEITNMLLPLITSPILARRLGVEAIGIYSYVYSISYYFVIVAVLGMFQYGTREIALVRDDRNKLNEKFSELFFAQLIIGIFVLIVYVGYSLFISEYSLFFMIQGISLIGSSFLLINWLFSGLEEFKIISVKTMIIRTIGVLAIILFVKNSDDLYIYFIVMAMEPFIGALVYINLAKKRVSIVKINIKKLRGHFRGMILLFIPVLTTYLYSSMDKIMLGKMSSMSSLGYYDNASKALIAKNLATALSAVLVPRMSSLVGKNNENEFGELLKKSANVVLLLTIAFGLGTAAISSIFSVVFWGENYIECGNLIMVMSLTLPAYGLTYVINNQLLVPKKRERVYIFSTIIGVIVNFVLNVILIYKYSAFGAALATLITQYLVLVIEIIIVRKDINLLECIRENNIYIVFGCIMIGIVKYIDTKIVYNIFYLILEILIGGIVFSILCIIYWGVSKKREYLDMIKSLKIIYKKESIE